MIRPRTAVVLTFITLSLAAGVLASGDQQGPPAQGQRPVVPPGLRDKAVQNGNVRVIAALRLRGGSPQAEALLARGGGPQAVSMQRQDIADARGRVIAQVAAAGGRETRRFQTLPFVALEVNANALDALGASPDVLELLADNVLKPSLEFSVPRLEADQVWASGFDGGGTMVAVLDSGVDAAHPFFGGKVVEEACFSSTSAGLTQSVCPNGETSQTGAGAAAPCALDECFHGTHVAGIVAGSGAAAGVPFSGVAKGANLAAVQVFSAITDAGICGGAAPCLGGFESDIMAGLEHVYSLKVAGANVAAVNMSLGGGLFAAPCDDSPIKPAIDNLRGVGVATIVAAGNNGEPTNLSSPACISSAVSVGATTLDDQVAWFSNVTPFLSLFAPGEEIVSAIPGDDYAPLSGTSMAAPHVAGAWAVIRQAVPGANVDAVLAALQNTGVPVTDTRDWAPGTTTVRRVRLFNALSSLTTIANPLPELTAVTPAAVRAGLPVTLTLSGAGFNSRSIVRWNGADVTSVTESVGQITAMVPATAVVLGTAQVIVFNPAPGGGTSVAMSVNVLPPPTLTVSPLVVGPGANVTVTMTDGFGGQLDWLALAASSAPDGTYLASTFIGAGVTTHSWTTQAPTTAGVYEFRMFLNNGFERVATSPTFTVDAAISPEPALSSMSPTEAVAGTAGPLTLTVHGSRFVAASVVRWNGSPLPTTYVNTTQLLATVSTANLAVAGAIPVTVHTPSPGGGTSAPLTFTVTAAPVLTVSAASVVGGSSVTVTLTNGLGGSLDYFAFAEASAPNNNYIEFTYVGAGITTRTWTVTAPSTPGTYEFRLFRQGSLIRATTSPTVTVTAPPPPVLAVSSTSVAGGTAVTVTLTNGQGGNQDWLAFATTNSANNVYVQFTYVGAGVTTRTWTVTAPNTAGSYEFRLFRNGTFTRLATSPTITVTGPPPPPPALTVSQTTAAPGAAVTMTLTNGPGGASDFLALASTSAPDGTYLQSTNVGAGVTTRTWTVNMPATPGTYHFRLFVVNGGVTSRAATSPTVTVQVTATPQLTVSATTVTAGASLTVTLTNGPGAPQDWLAFAPVSAPNNSYVQFTYVGAGVSNRTWTITAPSTAGTYEFRLFNNGSFTRLATSPSVTVQAAPPPVLTVSATSGVPGQSVTVTLTNGLGGATDWLAFAPVGAPDNSYVTWTYVGAGVTTRTWTVTLPSTPGNYEFRLYRQATFIRAATSPTITVGPVGDR